MWYPEEYRKALPREKKAYVWNRIGILNQLLGRHIDTNKYLKYSLSELEEIHEQLQNEYNNKKI